MKILSISLYLGTIGLLLVSCGEPEQPVETVSWYRVNKTERKTMLARCRANPDLMKTDKNCQNAEHAENNPAKSWGIEGSQ